MRNFDSKPGIDVICSNNTGSPLLSSIQTGSCINHETPIPNSYWVVPGKLLAGEYPRNREQASSLAKLKALLETGVTAFVDLTEPDEPLEPYPHLLDGLGGRAVSVRRFAIRDVSVPSSRELVVQILDHIDGVMTQGGIVYLHCWGGVGRTGTIVGCWLSRHGYRGRPLKGMSREKTPPHEKK